MTSLLILPALLAKVQFIYCQAEFVLGAQSPLFLVFEQDLLF